MRALTDFLLREALALLLDDPTPHNVAQAMGSKYAQQAPLSMESQTEEASEDSESQAAMVGSSMQRVMMVRSTNSAEQRITLVDRSFSIDAFMPQSLIDRVKAQEGFLSISRLRGSVIRIAKYHFSTPARCDAIANGGSKTKQPRSVSTRLARRSHAKLCLHVDALELIDATELAVNPMPDLEEHPAVAKSLRALSEASLEQRLVLRQKLESLSSAEAPVAPSPAKRFDDRNPLLDEDCEIPEDQARELDAQEGWGENGDAGPTDSQLIAENGPVSGGDSQATSSGNMIGSSSDHTVVSSSDAQSPDRRPRLVVPETESQAPATVQSQTAGEDSVPDSQDFHFQKENLHEAFKECSDTDSDDEEYLLAQATTSQPSLSQPTQELSAEPSEEVAASHAVDLTGGHMDGSSGATQSQQSTPPRDVSQPPLTQQFGLSSSLTLTEDSSTEGVAASQASQAPGEFVGAVQLDHDEPMTQQADETQVASQSFLSTSAQSDEPHVQAHESSDRDGNQQDDETHDVEYGAPEVDDTSQVSEGEPNEAPRESQQDGQADHLMNTQPNDPSPAKRAREERGATAATTESPKRNGLTAEQRRKRRRTIVPTSESQPLSPQAPSAKAVHVQQPATAVAASTASRSRAADSLMSRPDRDTFASSFRPASSSSSSSTVPMSFVRGIGAFSKKTADPQLQRMRPSKRYEHLLPPFDWATVIQAIKDKKE